MPRCASRSRDQHALELVVVDDEHGKRHVRGERAQPAGDHARIDVAVEDRHRLHANVAVYEQAGRLTYGNPRLRSVHLRVFASMSLTTSPPRAARRAVRGDGQARAAAGRAARLRDHHLAARPASRIGMLLVAARACGRLSARLLAAERPSIGRVRRGRLAVGQGVRGRCASPLGSTLQALAGRALVARFIGVPLRLNRCATSCGCCARRPGHLRDRRHRRRRHAVRARHHPRARGRRR